MNKKAPKSKKNIFNLALDGMDVGNYQEGGKIVSVIGVNYREANRGGGVGDQGDIVEKTVNDENTAADKTDIYNWRENR